MERQLTVIGRVERASFADLGIRNVPVKMDTGADASSIWAHVSEVRGDNLHVIFFGETSDLYTGKEHVFTPDNYTITRISNSFGHRELRYKVKLRIRLKGRMINGTFTLSDRATKLYPVLIGRSLLHNKFIVDVSQGKPLRREEKERTINLKEEMKKIKGDIS